MRDMAKYILTATCFNTSVSFNNYQRNRNIIQHSSTFQHSDFRSFSTNLFYIYSFVFIKCFQYDIQSGYQLDAYDYAIYGALFEVLYVIFKGLFRTF